MIKQVRNAFVCSIALFLSTGCEPPASDGPGDDDGSNQVPAHPTWGAYKMSRPQRSKDEVRGRAGALVSVLRPDATAQAIDEALIEGLKLEGTSPAEFAAGGIVIGDGGLFVSYDPQLDALTVFVNGASGSNAPEAPRDRFTHADAQDVAQACLRALEATDLIRSGLYGRQDLPEVAVPDPDSILPSNDFVFAPILDGLPVRSSDILITVDSSKQACTRFNAAWVDYDRVGPTHALVTTEAEAQAHVERHVLAEGATAIRQHGFFGYMMAPSERQALVPARYISRFVADYTFDGAPTPGAQQMKALSLDDPSAPLVDLFDGL